MPIIILTGYPSSGKTTRSIALKEYFQGLGRNVKILSENLAIPKAGFCKNEYYEDSQKEKIVRADLKSEAIRLMSKDSVVILDAGNYIKGAVYIFFTIFGLFIVTKMFMQAIDTSYTVQVKQPEQHNVLFIVQFHRQKLGNLTRNDTMLMKLNQTNQLVTITNQ